MWLLAGAAPSSWDDKHQLQACTQGKFLGNWQPPTRTGGQADRRTGRENMSVYPRYCSNNQTLDSCCCLGSTISKVDTQARCWVPGTSTVPPPSRSQASGFCPTLALLKEGRPSATSSTETAASSMQVMYPVPLMASWGRSAPSTRERASPQWVEAPNAARALITARALLLCL